MTWSEHAWNDPRRHSDHIHVEMGDFSKHLYTQWGIIEAECYANGTSIQDKLRDMWTPNWRDRHVDE